MHVHGATGSLKHFQSLMQCQAVFACLYCSPEAERKSFLIPASSIGKKKIHTREVLSGNGIVTKHNKHFKDKFLPIAVAFYLATQRRVLRLIGRSSLQYSKILETTKRSHLCCLK